MRVRPSSFAAVVLVIATSACGSGGAAPVGPTTAAGVATGAPAPTSGSSGMSATPTSMASSTTSTAGSQQVSINKTVWLGADEVLLQTMTVDKVSGIRLEGKVINRNTVDIEGQKALSDMLPWLATDSANIEMSGEFPTIPVGTTMKVVWKNVYDLTTVPDLTQAKLVFGSGQTNQSIVPLDGSPVTTFAAKIDPLGVITIPSKAYTTTITNSIYRAGFGRESKGHRELIIRVELVGRLAQTGGYGVTTSAFVLVDKAGNRLVGDSVAYGGFLNVVLGQDRRADGWVRFYVDDFVGPFTLETTTHEVRDSKGTAPIPNFGQG